jgi:hypothetical protein
MVITKLQGGLGNQIFQWAAGKSLSLDFKIPCYFDDEFYFKNSSDTKRTLDITKMPNVDELSMVGVVGTKHFFLIKDNFHHDSFLNKIRFVQNSNKTGNIFLDGYWQSEKYFLKNKNQILQELQPDILINQKINDSYSFFEQEKTISLHIRRTDYLTSGGFHPAMPKEYYDQAIETCNAQNYDVKKVVFSDDIKWCKENLKYENVIYIEGNSNVMDLYIMSKCNDNVIANSSFSWWGAYLNSNQNKKVIAPKIWFGSHTNMNTNDIIPNEWEKI